MILTVELSLKVPCAANNCDDPKLMVGLAGVTAIEFKVAVVTVRVRGGVALIPAKEAETVVVPGATPVATPALAEELLTVATDGADDVQVTAEVKSNFW